ncbi:unnamed protein product, partial [Rotaria sp. Silwood1]
MIIHSQWPNACIQWLKKIESRPSYTTDFLINLILQKLARHTIAIEILNKLNCTKILIEKILCALSKLFINDNILKKCLNENNQLLDCLCQLLIQYSIITSNTIQIHQLLNDETLIILTNLLWSISFHESYQEKLKLNINFIHTLSNLATSSLLYTSTHIKTIPQYFQQQSHIMISYSHSNSIFCHELVEHLSNHIYVWVDYKQEHYNSIHSDDLWEEIAAAMETATVIILIVSKEYYDSKSCRQELSYACDTLKKRIVPVYAPNQKYKANGWLGIRIAGQKYIHFGRKTFTDALNELLSILTIDQKSMTIQNSSNKMISMKLNEEENSLKNWTSKDIQKWFNDNRIHNDLITLFADRFYTATALIVYARHLKQFYEDEYIQIKTNYHKTFNGKQLQTLDFITFVDALWRLREKHDPQ